MSDDDGDGLHPLLRSRFSPLAFDPDHRLSERDVDVLLEAARWAPSAGNSQPWGFVVARRGEPRHEALLPRLAPSSRRWAPSASALVVNLAHRRVDDSDLPYSEFADYDLGQAVAHLTLQAHALGLACRQFRAFDLDGVAAEIGLADGWDLVSMTAVGRPAEEQPQRERRDVVRLQRDPLAG
ncbi:nitroreductase family protein [Nocardioides panacisoli]|uniref:Nitroreductase family protein n=1 Tax=Nocardioides panacisoli TaxID=627624 RepID=A0ABP7ILR5_9ACTN